MIPDDVFELWWWTALIRQVRLLLLWKPPSVRASATNIAPVLAETYELLNVEAKEMNLY